MTPTRTPVSLEQLQTMIEEIRDREAIRACLTRYARGVDRFDRELILSAFHPDFIDEHGKFVGTREEFVDWALGQHRAAHLSHQHYLMNHHCDLVGDVAHCETYFLFVAMNRKGKAAPDERRALHRPLRKARRHLGDRVSRVAARLGEPR
jgi:hypothetical protein